MFGEHSRTSRAPIQVDVATKKVLPSLDFVIIYTVGYPIPVTLIPSPGHPGWGSSRVFQEPSEALTRVVHVFFILGSTRSGGGLGGTCFRLGGTCI